MRHTHLNNDMYIVHTPYGIRTVNRETMNFNKVKKKLQEGAPDEEILELLKPADLPNGIYKAYYHKHLDNIVIKHITKNGIATWCDLMENTIHQPHTEDIKLTGVYVSMEAVIEDTAEYLI